VEFELKKIIEAWAERKRIIENRESDGVADVDLRRVTKFLYKVADIISDFRPIMR